MTSRPSDVTDLICAALMTYAACAPEPDSTPESDGPGDETARRFSLPAFALAVHASQQAARRAPDPDDVPGMS